MNYIPREFVVTVPFAVSCERKGKRGNMITVFEADCEIECAVWRDHQGNGDLDYRIQAFICEQNFMFSPRDGAPFKYADTVKITPDDAALFSLLKDNVEGAALLERLLEQAEQESV